MYICVCNMTPVFVWYFTYGSPHVFIVHLPCHASKPHKMRMWVVELCVQLNTRSGICSIYSMYVYKNVCVYVLDS